VQRNRFAPVKSTADLLSVRSDAYELSPEFRLELIPDRNSTPPIVKLEHRYKLVDRFEELVSEGVPSLARCRSLTVEGNMKFRRGVVVVGNVKFINAEEGTKIVDEGTYENCDVILPTGGQNPTEI
jgi:UTP--glucose-1-phosphate uridylyltransferase